MPHPSGRQTVYFDMKLNHTGFKIRELDFQNASSQALFLPLDPSSFPAVLQQEIGGLVTEKME